MRKAGRVAFSSVINVATSHSPMGLAWIVCAALSSGAGAQTSSAYDCDSVYDRRKVEIRYYSEDDASRCEVNYYKNQITLKQRLWWFRNDLPQCEVKARELVQRLQDGGFACVADGASETAPPERSGATTEPSRLTWDLAWAPRFGPKVEYPTQVFSVKEPPPENNDGIGYRSPDGQNSFSIWGASNVLGYSPAQAARFSREAFVKRQSVVTYFTQRENWFVISGKEAGKLFYQKAMIVDNGRIVLGLTIDYAESQKSFFDPIVSRMAQSLSAGPAEERCSDAAPSGHAC